MAAATAFASAFLYVPDNRLTTDFPGTPLVGAKAYFYVTGTTTPLPVFTESTLSVAWTQPIVTNSAGSSDGPIYMSPTPAFKIYITDADDVALPGYPVDSLSPYEVAT